ncbi:hypothetical protein BDAP_002104 [Binucleata daphniae]
MTNGHVINPHTAYIMNINIRVVNFSYVMTFEGLITKCHKNCAKRIELQPNMRHKHIFLVLIKTLERLFFDRRRGLELDRFEVLHKDLCVKLVLGICNDVIINARNRQKQNILINIIFCAVHFFLSL